MQKVNVISHELPYEISEELKYLRTNIQFCGTDKKVILLTSSVAGEGKSSTSLRLAQSLCKLGKMVLIVDADLRRSMMKHEVVDPKAIRYGLSHYLSGMVQLNEAVCETNDPRLYMVFAGPVPPNPSELLSNKRVDSLLNWAKEQFDYVLLDSAPLGVVIDAAVLAQKCDGAVVVVEADRIPYKTAQSVVQQLEDANCPVLGVVLNKVNFHSGRKYYNHYYK